MTKPTAAQIAEIYAVDALAGRRQAIERAVARAIAVRTGGTIPKGAWTGTVDPPSWLVGP